MPKIEEYPEFDFDLSTPNLKKLAKFYSERLKHGDQGPHGDPIDLHLTLMAVLLELRYRASLRDPYRQ